MTEWLALSEEVSILFFYFRIYDLGLLLSCSIMSNSLQPNGLQQNRVPCLSLYPRICSNSCPVSWWCRPTISFVIAPFSSCPQFFPATGSFLMSQFFASCGQSIGASASVLAMNIQTWFPLELISLQSKGLSIVFSNTTVWKQLGLGYSKKTETNGLPLMSFLSHANPLVHGIASHKCIPNI